MAPARGGRQLEQRHDQRAEDPKAGEDQRAEADDGGQQVLLEGIETTVDPGKAIVDPLQVPIHLFELLVDLPELLVDLLEAFVDAVEAFVVLLFEPIKPFRGLRFDRSMRSSARSNFSSTRSKRSARRCSNSSKRASDNSAIPTSACSRVAGSMR